MTGTWLFGSALQRAALLRGVVCLVVASTGGQPPTPDATRAPAQPTRLTAGTVTSPRALANDVHHYIVDLRAGQFFEISISQDEAPLLVTLRGLDGNELRKLTFGNIAPVPARVMYVSDVAGAYRVDIALNTPKLVDSGKRYVLRVLAVGDASPRDRARDRCFAMLARADALARSQSMASLQQAIALLVQTSACWRTEDDRDLETVGLSFLGGFASLFSQFRLEAAAAYERLVEIYVEAGDSEGELASLENLAVEYRDDGRFDKALETATRALALATELGPRRREARAHHDVALAAFLLGDYDRAHQSATSALRLATSLEDSSLMAASLFDLARLDDLSGHLEAAQARYEQALALKPADSHILATTLLDLGLLHLRRGDYGEAERRLQSRLEMSSMVQREQEAVARIGLGDVHMARGNRARARELYAQADAALASNVRTQRCIADERLGRVALTEDRADEAIARFNNMIAIAARVGHPPCEAEGRAGLADVAIQRADFASAEAEARQVIEVVERFREAVPDLESRALGFGSLAPAFDRAVFVSMQAAGKDDPSAAARALVFNERALARGLLDGILESALDRRAQIPESLAHERHRVRELWRTRLAQLQVATRSQSGRQRAELLLAEVSALDRQLRDLNARTDAIDARQSGLIRPPPISVGAIQALLDRETTLIEYALGDRQSYLWVVTATKLHAFALAPRAKIEVAARAVQHDLASASSAARSDARQRRRALARLILAPAAPLLTTRRLVVVTSGALALVPFAALPVPGAIPETPLMARHEVVHVPSATTLAAMRALAERRPRPSKGVVVFADPIFESADPRAVSAASRPSAARPAATARAQALASLGRSFPRLPFSRAEARAIIALRPKDVTTFLDGRATRDRVIGGAVADYKFIHFATHGVVHSEVPSLSSILMSFVDENGRTSDPLVTLSDVYAMTLRADVVVLSACSTAGGKSVPGEGVIGLARAFMYAGAPRVVASLWQVNDLATSELMRRFYRGMLIKGLAPAAALHAAQRELAAIPRWSSPYFWAPFVLQGDWR